MGHISATLLHTITKNKKGFRGAGEVGITYMITNTQFREHQAYLNALNLIANTRCSYSTNVVEKLILLFGDANRGKTKSLMEIGVRLGMPAGVITTQNVRIVLHYPQNGSQKTIFLSTYGDTVDDVMNNLHFFNMQIPPRCSIYEVINGQITQISQIKYVPDICIGASRIEEMHWDLYNRFVNSIVPIVPKPLMFRKAGTTPKPASGVLTKDDIDTINAIMAEL